MPISPLLSGLVEQRARLSGAILSVQERLEQLRAMLGHIDATIRFVEPSYRPDLIPPKRGGGVAGVLTHRELSRLCMEAVREAETPPTTRDVAKAVMRRAGLDKDNGLLLAAVERAAEKPMRRRVGVQLQRVLTGPRAIGWVMMEQPEEAAE